MSQFLQHYQQRASYYRAALLLGLVSGTTVVSWADSVIAHDADAPSQLFDLAMIPPDDLSELRHALQPLATGAESVSIIRALLDVVHRDLESGQRTVKDSVTVLAQARRFFALPAELADQIATLQDDLMLAGAGIVGNTAAVEVRVHTWLTQFSGSDAAFFEESVR